MAHDLYGLLKGKRNVPILTIHRLLYSLVAVPATGSDTNQWKCPLMCWLAISGLRIGGRFIPAYEYTRLLAKWEYMVRNLHFYEALINQDKYEDHLHGCVNGVLLRVYPF